MAVATFYAIPLRDHVAKKAKIFQKSTKSAFALCGKSKFINNIIL